LGAVLTLTRREWLLALGAAMAVTDWIENNHYGWARNEFVNAVTEGWAQNNFTTDPNVAVRFEDPGSIFVRMNQDGTSIEIDWDVAEQAAHDPKLAKSMTQALARILIAVRDGKWKAMVK